MGLQGVALARPDIEGKPVQVVVALCPSPCPTLTLETGVQGGRTWPLLLTDGAGGVVVELGGEREHRSLRKSVIVQVSSSLDHELG